MSDFNVAGVSKFNGEFKVRFCNDYEFTMSRLKRKDTDINLVKLPSSMSKLEACSYLLSLPEFKQHEKIIQEAMGKKEKAVNQPKLTIGEIPVDNDIEELKKIVNG